MYETSDFRNGLKIEYDNQPYVIIYFQHVKPGKGASFTRTKIRNLVTGRVLDPTFKSGEKVGRPDIEEKTMQYLYPEGDACAFMDTANYEQITIPKASLGEPGQFLKENMDCQVVFWNGRPITVDMPNHVNLKVVETAPGFRGDTATGASKTAKLETGATVSVPLFINEGDVLRIDTRTGEYLERISQ